MKHPDEDIDKTLDRLLRRIGDADTDQMEQRVGAVAQSLRAQIEPARDVLHTYARGVKTTAPRPRRRFAFAAALIVTVAIGIYAAQRSGLIPPALPIQRAIAPQVAPAGQTQTVPTVSANPSRASEPATTGALVGRTKEPGATRGGGAPFRTAAEEIAFLQGTDTGARRLQFGAASVRQFYDPNDHSPGVPLNCKGVDGLLFPVPDFYQDMPPTPQGRCVTTRENIVYLIRGAFSSSPLRAGWDWSGEKGPVIGVPDWRPPYFDIQATADDPSRVTKAELQQMLQNLLIDRFKLRFHREIREEDGYVLTVAKSGVKFKETSGPERQPQRGVGPAVPVEEARGLRQSGAFVPSVLKGNFRIGEIVKTLQSSFLFKPVDDKTGLKGIYDITLNFQRRFPLAGGGPRGATDDSNRPEFVPPIPKALEEQLGLVLTRGNVPVEYIVVEHIELPSPN
jgi:uncharacterized protein (TIGR03435 family)